MQYYDMCQRYCIGHYVQSFVEDDSVHIQYVTKNVKLFCGFLESLELIRLFDLHSDFFKFFKWAVKRLKHNEGLMYFNLYNIIRLIDNSLTNF